MPMRNSAGDPGPNPISTNITEVLLTHLNVTEEEALVTLAQILDPIYACTASPIFWLCSDGFILVCGDPILPE